MSVRAVEKQFLVVCVNEQVLRVVGDKEGLINEYFVATAKNGVGQNMGSECTPLGEHRIRAKIGANKVVNTVFIGRRPTGECYSPELAKQYPDRDWILTRILWLCGNESGYNRFGQVDTMRRYIYIHGAPDSHPMKVPSSHGCIKMRNRDIVKLFDQVEAGVHVNIVQSCGACL